MDRHLKLIEEFKQSLLAFDTDEAVALAHRLVMAHVPLMDIFQYAIMDSIDSLSQQFDAGELFIPQMLLTADTFESAIGVLMEGAGGSGLMKGRVMVYTVEGDIHDIGKNIVASMLRASGFEVIDLGRSIPAADVAQAAAEDMPDVIVGFALMTTTFPVLRELIEVLNEQGIRQKFELLVGGVMVTPEWAAEIGFDGYASNAFEAIRTIQQLTDSHHAERASVS